MGRLGPIFCRSLLPLFAGANSAQMSVDRDAPRGALLLARSIPPTFLPILPTLLALSSSAARCSHLLAGVSSAQMNVNPCSRVFHRVPRCRGGGRAPWRREATAAWRNVNAGVVQKAVFAISWTVFVFHYYLTAFADRFLAVF